jgi:phytoene synthase
VLGVLDERDPQALVASDAICTALQLTNHWQDARRDLVERNRIYVPTELFPGERLDERLRSTIEAGHAPDREFLAQWRACLADCVARTAPMYDSIAALEHAVAPRHRALLWLFAEGGRRTLARIEQWNFETCLDRPRLWAPEKAWIVLQAVLRARRNAP